MTMPYANRALSQVVKLSRQTARAPAVPFEVLVFPVSPMALECWVLLPHSPAGAGDIDNAVSNSVKRDMDRGY